MVPHGITFDLSSCSFFSFLYKGPLAIEKVSTPTLANSIIVDQGVPKIRKMWLLNTWIIQKISLALIWILSKSAWTIFPLLPFPPALFLQSSAGKICSYIGKCLHIQQKFPPTSRENPSPFFPSFFFAYLLTKEVWLESWTTDAQWSRFSLKSRIAGLGRQIGHLGYIWPNYQTHFGYSESLFHIF